MEELSGKTAFVTGAASGIGRGLADRFAVEGMNVMLADIEEGALASAVEEISATGANVRGAICDVSKRDSVQAAAKQAFDAFGGVHVLCNNAGISTFGPLAEATDGDWDWTVGVNLMGVVHGIQAFVPHMLAHREGGHVVNTASIGGLMPLVGCGVYTATKFAVVGISEVLSLEVGAQGIGVSVLCPSFVNTRLHESARNLPEGSDATKSVPDFVKLALGRGSSPAEMAALVVEGIRKNQLHILPHPESRPPIEARMNNVLAAFEE
jgi:NAD(P)-dependent dehydrogenase (short-subunit alcohol dehydrogenase family)